MADKLIKMIREDPMYDGGTVEADVSEFEVANWLKYGWRLMQDSTPKNNNKKRKVRE